MATFGQTAVRPTSFTKRQWSRDDCGYRRSFEDFLQTVEYFIERITSMDARTEDKQPEQWLDTADVCAGLQLDRRTVYSLREQGKLPFSQFQHRVYYKAKDVKALADGLKAKSPKCEETEIINPSK